jgi:demethylmenaquinone methyltransferase/2-methoxy-6-polyprenyl-1,4-benzoquinol methylase
MFAGIVPSYDLMNRLMSAGQDGRWRREAVAYAAPAGARALDLATGTGDLALELRRQGAVEIVAADFCAPMLTAAARKLRRRGALDVQLLVADALALPFRDASFDCLVAGFLLRNVADRHSCLTEMRRVLRPGGRAVSLDLSRPRASVLSPAVGLYMRHIVPTVGRLISRHPWAYSYLPVSVDPFPDAAQLRLEFLSAGFAQVEHHLLGFGSVAIHVGVKS